MKKSATKRFGYEMDANLVFEDVTQELEGDRKIDWGSLVGTVSAGA